MAIGAAIQANMLVGNRAGDDWLLLDVIPLSLGIETMGGLAEKIVPRNSTIPVARAQEFTTFKDGQTAMALHVVQGEREKVSRLPVARALRVARHSADGRGRCAHPRVVPCRRRRPAVGIAREQTTGLEASIVVKPSYGLTDAEIARMLQESFAHASDDAQAARAAPKLASTPNASSSRRESALAADADLLDADERAAIDARTRRRRGGCDGDDQRALAKAVAALNNATGEFAARRMDRGVARALTGKRVDALG